MVEIYIFLFTKKYREGMFYFFLQKVATNSDKMSSLTTKAIHTFSQVKLTIRSNVNVS